MLYWPSLCLSPLQMCESFSSEFSFTLWHLPRNGITNTMKCVHLSTILDVVSIWHICDYPKYFEHTYSSFSHFNFYIFKAGARKTHFPIFFVINTQTNPWTQGFPNAYMVIIASTSMGLLLYPLPSSVL